MMVMIHTYAPSAHLPLLKEIGLLVLIYICSAGQLLCLFETGSHVDQAEPLLCS